MKRRFDKKWLFITAPIILSVFILCFTSTVLRPVQAKYVTEIPAGFIRVKGEEQKLPIEITATYKTENQDSPFYKLSFFVNNISGKDINITSGTIQCSLKDITTPITLNVEETHVARKQITSLIRDEGTNLQEPLTYSAALIIDGQQFNFTGNFQLAPTFEAEHKTDSGEVIVSFYVTNTTGKTMTHLSGGPYALFDSSSDPGTLYELLSPLQPNERSEVGYCGRYRERPIGWKFELTKINNQPFYFIQEGTFSSAYSLSTFSDPLVYKAEREGDRLYLDVASGTYAGDFNVSWDQECMQLLNEDITVNKTSSDSSGVPYSASFTDSISKLGSKRYVFLLSGEPENTDFTVTYGDGQTAVPYTGSTISEMPDTPPDPIVGEPVSEEENLLEQNDNIQTEHTHLLDGDTDTGDTGIVDDTANTGDIVDSGDVADPDDSNDGDLFD